jgi:predicted AlkP superfamily pyrophosphatase or phosphodiesterase
MFRRLLSAVLLLTCSTAAQNASPPVRDLKPTVILISLDGFRWDYLKPALTPNLYRLMREGSSAEALIPSFPTKTFPNHYTIVTGLYPAHHGIIANNMWDPSLGKFSTDDRKQVQDGRWWGGEPIWVTAEKAGQKTAPMFWPGGEAAIEGVRPTYEIPFDAKMSHGRRLEQFFGWLDSPPTDRPTFFTLYFQDVDDAGHDFGPGSPEQIAAVKKVDSTIGHLLAGLQARGVDDQVNVIVVSDHGMVLVTPEQVIYLDDFIDLASVRISDWSPVLMLSAGEHNADVLARLKTIPHLTVYRKQDVPARLHFRDNDRIPPIIAIADPGWRIISHGNKPETWKAKRGEHGYDNADRDTWGIFIARGPAFRPGKRIPPFANIHIYNALCSILGLRPAPNDGSLQVLAPVLRVPIHPRQQTAPRTSALRTTLAADRRSQTAAR